MSEVDSIIASLDDIDVSLFDNNADRIRARDALNNALRRLQSPWDIAWDHVIGNSSGNAAIKTLIDVGVFKSWAEAGGEPITCTELARLTGKDETLIRRMMRCIAGQYLVIETDFDTYARTPWAKSLGDDQGLRAWYGGFYSQLIGPLLRTLPVYLKEAGYKNPTDHTNCNFQHWQGPDSMFFNYVGSNPLLTADFNDAMEGNSRGNLTDWPKIYPTETLVEGALPGRAVVVDVGGGKGHDLKKFHLRNPTVPASDLILQDLPAILKNVERDPGFTIQEYDFFTPQPVKGARAYFAHGVLHDWPELKAVEILKIVAEAMDKGYSKLLIHENMINERNPVARVTSLDVLMMGGLAAAERTESQWRSIITSAGLKIVKIWRGRDMAECIIEAELV
ncbi:Demethylsterigmatocystin 6-O-methyltransferase 2 [Colletotrichum truncatum]|uniref:Demethylsterigmatocystin 6-O-methyltransferase 2 n=1 Tax=Colletotrichum truncatum TaxID=5467 RepID=A0ACC3YPR1_COLTU|nr:Demethylsterigmatocystin 6-O-methyltransferase 2 [Colletotrichum truncatum]KAF6796907.1 Demethylsterigmatocystin 6-O-methyltransferase 2 [Colletotrichum truncatum]